MNLHTIVLKFEILIEWKLYGGVSRGMVHLTGGEGYGSPLIYHSHSNILLNYHKKKNKTKTTTTTKHINTQIKKKCRW